MNKKLSRIAAIALSAAMVTSAFAMSTSASFAATVASMKQDTVPTYAVVYDSDKQGAAVADPAHTGNVNGQGEVALSALFAGQDVKIEQDKDSAKLNTTTDKAKFSFKDATFTVASNGGIVKLNKAVKTTTTADDVTVLNADKTVADNDTTVDKLTEVAKIEGAGTSSGTVEATVTASNVKVSDAAKTLEVGGFNKTAKVDSGVVTLTAKLKIYNNGTVLVVPKTTDNDAAVAGSGKTVDQSVEIGINEKQAFTNYGVKADTDSAFAKYDAADANAAALFVKPTGSSIKSDANAPIAVKTFTAAAQDPDKLPTGTVTSTVYAATKDTDTAAAAKTIAASLTVGTYYTVNADHPSTMSVSRIYGQPTKTLMKDGTAYYDVTNRDIKDDTALTVAGEDAKIGKVTGTGTVNVDSGTVSSIDVDGAVLVDSAAANVGNTTVGSVKSGASVTVTGTQTANDDGTYSAVTTGDISSKVVTLNSFENESNKTAQGQVKVGNVTANVDNDTTGTYGVTVTTSKDVKTLTAGTFAGTAGRYADSPYAATFTLAKGSLTTGNLQYFGKVTVGTTEKSDLTAGTISTGTYAQTGLASTDYGYIAVPTAEKNVSDSTIAIANSSKLDAQAVTVGKVMTGCEGSITIPAGKLTLADSSDANSEATYSGLSLYVPGAKSGTVLYTSRKKAGNLFTIAGIDSVKATDMGNNVYSYAADKVEFIGFKMNQTEVNVGDGASTTLTTTMLPDVDLPADVTLKWEADKDTVKLTPSADTKSCTVTSTGYTAANVNGGNNVVVTATLVNKDGSAYVPASNSDKTVGTCNVTLTSEVAPVLTTKVKNLNDTEAKAVTGDTVIKMTQSTYATVEFSADKAGIANINYITANDKVAQTGTASAWNGTAGKYNVYANGKVGDKVGVFANGVKVFQIEIVDRPFECDTTLDLDGVKAPALTVGQKYSFKIRKANPAIKDFTFLTANDSAVASWGFVKNADGTVTATIKALKATDKIGVYAKINGVTYKVFAAAVK